MWFLAKRLNERLSLAVFEASLAKQSPESTQFSIEPTLLGSAVLNVPQNNPTQEINASNS
jgi:hypothetical protein